MCEVYLVLLRCAALLVGGNVVVELQRLLVALHSDAVLLSTVPPVGDAHARLTHLPSLEPRKLRDNTKPCNAHLCPGHLIDALLFLKVKEAEQIGDAGVRWDVGFPPQHAVRQTRLDGYNCKLVLVHGLHHKVQPLDHLGDKIR